MRQMISALLALLLLAPHLPARTSHDWNQVRKIKADALIGVFLWNGERLSGYLESADDSGLRLDEESWRRSGQSNHLHEIDREAIRKIVRLPNPPHLPDPEKWMALGALAGAGVGVAIGATGDLRDGNNGRGLKDGLAGALCGFFGSVVLLGAIATGATAKVAVHHKIIYEGTSPPSSPVSK